MSKSVVFSDRAPAPIGPYSQAVKSGDTLYVSGQIPIDAQTGDIVSSGIADETRQVMKNVLYVLEAANMNFSNVVKSSIFVTDMNDFAVVNETYETFFVGEDPPARETVEVAALPKGVHVEISCIAVVV